MKKLLFVLTLSIASIIVARSQSQDPISTIKQDKSIKNLRAYPNPFVTETQISFISNKSRPAILKVKNLLGKTVYKKEFITRKGKNDFTFYKDNLESGMYIYSLQTESEIISKRLVIK